MTRAHAEPSRPPRRPCPEGESPRRWAFQCDVRDELAAMGWPPKSYAWVAPTKLVVTVKGEIKVLTLRANMGAKKLNRALGYLHGMADALGMGAA
jgi:hypothetical protein